MPLPDPILQSWQANATNWIETIDGNEIESRVAVTNQAIVDAILGYKPATAVDIGCGEGWLTRTLQSNGINCFGIDAIPALVENARQKGGDHYGVASYGDVVNGLIEIKKYEALVFNFSLLDEKETESIIVYLGQHLQPGSLVFIQTLHPFTVAGEDAYVTGWRDGSWKGLKRDFVEPYQWYFRTLESWTRLFNGAGFALQQVKEPLHPSTQKPASIIFVLKK